MNNLHNNFNHALDLLIEAKLEKYIERMDEKISKLESSIEAKNNDIHKEILQQKEVFELLGIGRRRLKNWVERGLGEMRVDNRVYYRYAELMEFIEAETMKQMTKK